jgi:glutamyl-tRNA synthetase
MLRFAPSPTGDMHIGNLRVALFNYIMSKKRNEPLLIRIEDTDKERNIAGKEDEILAILALFGITYQEHQMQSNALKFHRAMALQLLHDKKAFNCFCTPETLEASRESAKESKIAYRYDGACENLPAEEVIDNMNPFTIRLRKPDHSITVTDIIKGQSTFAPNDIDSFIIMRADKYPTYNFACAVDDMLADVSLIIRGEDHLSNTPKQIAIQQALGYDRTIEYAHLPIILGAEGKKMSKRDDASSVKWLLEEGFIPSAIINYLILMGNKTPKEIFTLEEAIEWFSLETISKSPAFFDIDKLRFINREHLKMMEPKELSRYVGFADEEIGNLTKLFIEEASTLKELREKISAIFAPKIVPNEYQAGFTQLQDAIKNAPYFEEYEGFKNYLIEHTGLKGKNLFKPLRILIGGCEHGPELADLYSYLKNYLGEINK